MGVTILGLSVDFSNMDIFHLKYEKIDSLDRYILLDLYKTYDATVPLYRIEDIDLYNFFFKGILRELFSVIIYFKELDIVVLSGYDLSLPIYFKNIKTYNYYNSLAKENKLFFR